MPVVSVPTQWINFNREKQGQNGAEWTNIYYESTNIHFVKNRHLFSLFHLWLCKPAGKGGNQTKPQFVKVDILGFSH